MSDLHPFDFDRLSKGTWIDTDELERAAMLAHTDPSFGLAVLRLKVAIEQHTGILSRVEGARLRLMTDGEALVWSIREAALASRALDRNARRLVHNIDRSRLTTGEQTTHEHATRVVSAMAAAQRAERRKHARLFAVTSSHTSQVDMSTSRHVARPPG